MYVIPLGTPGKLISLNPHKDIDVELDVKDWTTRRALVFTESLIDPSTIAKMDLTGPNDRKPLAVRLALEGYILFGGESGGDRTAKYVLAVPLSKVNIV